MKILKISIVLIAFSLASGCRRAGALKEKSDRNMRVQVARMTPVTPKDDMAVYRVRLIPSEILRTIHKELGSEHYWYRMDSCFYLDHAGHKQYPVVLQPVANGSKDNYEYLLQFVREMPSDSSDSVRFVFADKAINDIKYEFNLAF
ncbi:hypothetical protein ACFQZX_13970 [Mucilaginibacter litoreus]|uniref:Lipoprotein n=1 Tax=Mucilaginibacter litoreus TaxID=1048221 RepID=A0ABW3AWI5_9SPHI